MVEVTNCSSSYNQLVPVVVMQVLQTRVDSAQKITYHDFEYCTQNVPTMMDFLLFAVP